MMNDLASIIGLIGLTMASSGFVFSLISNSRIDKLEQKLKQLKVLE